MALFSDAHVLVLAPDKLGDSYETRTNEDQFRDSHVVFSCFGMYFPEGGQYTPSNAYFDGSDTCDQSVNWAQH